LALPKILGWLSHRTFSIWAWWSGN